MIRLFLLLLSLPFLLAFNFSPMSQVMNLGEGKKSAQFILENGSKANMAVEITVKTRKMDDFGVETYEDTKELSVFPPQVIIPPNEKRTIRVMYNGPMDIETEKSYRVIAEQLEVKVDPKIKDQPGIQVLMQYVAALYATPKDAKSKIRLVSYQSTKDELTLVVANDGNRHQLLNNSSLKFTYPGGKGEFKSGELKGMEGENVLAGRQRVFRIKTSKVIPEGAQVELKLND